MTATAGNAASVGLLAAFGGGVDDGTGPVSAGALGLGAVATTTGLGEGRTAAAAGLLCSSASCFALNSTACRSF